MRGINATIKGMFFLIDLEKSKKKKNSLKEN